jgi:hypothetical protein
VSQLIQLASASCHIINARGVQGLLCGFSDQVGLSCHYLGAAVQGPRGGSADPAGCHAMPAAIANQLPKRQDPHSGSADQVSRRASCHIIT